LIGRSARMDFRDGYVTLRIDAGNFDGGGCCLACCFGFQRCGVIARRRSDYNSFHHRARSFCSRASSRCNSDFIAIVMCIM
jgi:hypothetical protein